MRQTEGFETLGLHRTITSLELPEIPLLWIRIVFSRNPQAHLWFWRHHGTTIDELVDEDQDGAFASQKIDNGKTKALKPGNHWQVGS